MTKEPGGPQSMRSQRIRHNWVAECTPRLAVNLSRWHRDFPYSLPPHIHNLLHYQHPTVQWYKCYNTWTYIDKVHSSLNGVHSTGFDTCIVTCFYYNSVLQDSFTTPQILCAPPSHSSFLLTPGNLWSFHCLHHFAFPQCHSWNQCVAFTDWLLSLTNMYWSFHHSFHGLIVHLFLLLNNIPLSGCTAVYSFVY